MIEGLLVLLYGRLTIVGCHQMSAAVAYVTSIVQATLLGKAYGGVIGPAVIAADVFVRPHGTVHHVSSPDGGVLGLIIENRVRTHLLT